MSSNHTVAVSILVLLLIVFGPQPARAQLLTERTPGQMKQLLADALESKKRVGKLRAYIARNTVVFDVTLQPNPDETEWMVLLNLTPQQFQEAQTRYGREGYTVANSSAVSANGQQFHSAVWLKTVATVGSLVLPTVPLPESGTVVGELKSIDGLMRSFLKANNASGATVAIAKDGQIVYDRAFGWSNARDKRTMGTATPMRIAGISKCITAVAVMQLVEQGRLSLDQAVLPLLQKAKFRGSTKIKDPRWARITVRHLLNHTAGFGPAPVFQTPMIAQEFRLNKPATRKDIVRYQFLQNLGADPGHTYLHSDFGYCLLGRVIEVVSGRLYGPYIQENILDPAKAENTKIGRTKVEDRPRNEAWYHMQKETVGAAFWSASVAKVGRGGKGVDAPYIVRKPDGGWNLEAMDSHNGWISTAGDMLRFVTAMESPEPSLLQPNTLGAMLAAPPGQKDEWYACGWFVRPTPQNETTAKHRQRIWHGGALDGSSTMLVRRKDGVAWCVLFNTDLSNSGDKPLAGLIVPFFDATLSGIPWPK